MNDEANTAAQRTKKRWEIDNLMVLPADEPSAVVGTVLDPLPTRCKRPHQQFRPVNGNKNPLNFGKMSCSLPLELCMVLNK